MNAGMVTLGVDCATQPSAASYCAIHWDQPRPWFENPRRPAQDWSDLVGRLGGAGEHECFAGLDVPLGWPRSFVRAISQHADGRPWPAGDGLDQHYFRATDLRVSGRRPLSVSTNLLGATAIKAAMLLRPFAADGRLDRSGLSGAFCEVYPRAALAAWGLLPNESYKRPSSGRRVREAVAARLCSALPWMALRPEAVGRLAEDDDHLDAFVAALVARLVKIRRGVIEPKTDDVELAREEGWIWVPKSDSLALLAASDSL